MVQNWKTNFWNYDAKLENYFWNDGTQLENYFWNNGANVENQKKTENWKTILKIRIRNANEN